jgi:hypothetical protein
LKKLTGLLIFVLALVGAIALTRYYSSRQAQSPVPTAPERPVPPSAPDVISGPATTNQPVTFKIVNAILDFETGKSHLTLELERDPARPAPEKLWVWAYFFASDRSGERSYCSGEPVEVRSPFTTGGRETINVTASIPACPQPRTPSSTYYARVNISTESSFAARLSERQISYDISAATPVVAQGARPARR